MPYNTADPAARPGLLLPVRALIVGAGTTDIAGLMRQMMVFQHERQLQEQSNRQRQNDKLRDDQARQAQQERQCQEDQARKKQEDIARHEQARQTQQMFAALMRIMGAATELPPSPLL